MNDKIVSIIDSEDYYFIQVGASCLRQRKHQINATEREMSLEELACVGLADHYIKFPPKVPLWYKVYSYIWACCETMSRAYGGV